MSDVMIPNWTLGERMAKAREVAGLSSVDAAEFLGVTDRTIRNWESGSTHPKPFVMRVWSEMTGVPLWWLLDDNPPEHADTAGYPGQMSLTLLDLAA